MASNQPSVFIDGEAGTTGLGIRTRLEIVPEITLRSVPEAQVVRACEDAAILDTGLRIDGRNTKTVRPIVAEVGVLPRAHGSALFTRGETQAFCVATGLASITALKIVPLITFQEGVIPGLNKIHAL